MTLTLKGDLPALRRLERRLSNTDAMLTKASKAMAEETVDLIKDGYRTETDPSGQKWADKQRQDGRKVLSGKTSRLKGGWHVDGASAAGYEVSASVDYALPHQRPRKGRNGRLKRPQRKQIPEAADGLPSKWADALEETAGDVVRAHFGKG
ncbi:MAG: hypothetical protein ACWGPR_08565 [Candidatus Deferrimicrobiaceae bacterium]